MTCLVKRWRRITGSFDTQHPYAPELYGWNGVTPEMCAVPSVPEAPNGKCFINWIAGTRMPEAIYPEDVVDHVQFADCPRCLFFYNIQQQTRVRL